MEMVTLYHATKPSKTVSRFAYDRQRKKYEERGYSAGENQLRPAVPKAVGPSFVPPEVAKESAPKVEPVEVVSAIVDPTGEAAVAASEPKAAVKAEPKPKNKGGRPKKAKA